MGVFKDFIEGIKNSSLSTKEEQKIKNEVEKIESKKLKEGSDYEEISTADLFKKRIASKPADEKTAIKTAKQKAKEKDEKEEEKIQEE